MPRISELPTTSFPNLGHEFAAEREGETHRLTVAQIRALLQYQADEIGLDETNVALALSALDSGKVNVDDLADYVTLSALNAARWPIAKLDDIPTGTLIGRTDSGSGAASPIAFADLRTPLNDCPLLYQWSDADLTGATAFVVDFGREDFVAYRCVMVGISGQSAGGYSFLRCGNPDTNTIYSGANDYVERWIGYFSSPSIYGGSPAAQAYVNAFRPLSSGSSNVSEVTFSFKNSFWIASMRSSYLDQDGQDFIISRTVRYIGGGGTDNRRLMIGSSVPLAGVGAIRIYGIR